jgi:hypothetical protein
MTQIRPSQGINHDEHLKACFFVQQGDFTKKLVKFNVKPNFLIIFCEHSKEIYHSDDSNSEDQSKSPIKNVSKGEMKKSLINFMGENKKKTWRF